MTGEEKLAKLVTDVEVIKTKMELLTKNLLCTVHSEKLHDHEERIRVLEDFKSKTMGVLVAVSALSAVIGALTGILINLFVK